NHALTLGYADFQNVSGEEVTNYVSRITDWTGRTVHLNYDTNTLDLIEIVDAANITNRMGYDGNHWITNLVTPYGTTTFDHYQLIGSHSQTRYVTITEPNGARQRYYFESADDQVPNVLDPLADGV